MINLALGKRATVFFLMVAILLGGGMAYSTLPRESFPDIPIPVVVAITPYPGAAPDEVETQVTDPIERQLKGLAGLKTLTSVSQEGSSVVTVELVAGSDVDTALQKVRDRVDLAKADFPDDAEDPILQEVNFSDIPIVQINLGGGVGPVVLKQLAEDLADELEAISGVLRVNVVGGLEREIQVDVDPERLRLFGLSLDDVVDCVKDENVSIPGGDLDLGDWRFAVRTPGEVDDPREIESFVIKAPGGRPIFVRDVATVTYGFEERTSYARINGEEAVALTVQKRQGANLIAVADATKAQLEESRRRWPAGVEATILGDQSKDIRTMVLDLENNILSGLLLVVLVLMFALGFRNAFFVGLAIPFSMLITFMVLQMQGTTLNMVVLFSLVLAVGMLVDNGVVVVENIYRHMQNGVPRWEAAAIGTKEVAAAIAVSTFTTVGAFAPLLFWPGIVGEFMSFLPRTLSVALLASLVVAFVINPVLCATFMKVKPGDMKADAGAAGDDRGAAGGRLGDRILSRYRQSLEWALDHRGLTLAGVLGCLVGVLFLFVVFNPGIEFFPETEPPQILVDVELSPGTRVEKTDAVVAELERRFGEIADTRVMAAATGAGAQATFGASSEGGESARGRITLDLIDRKERSQSSFLTMDRVWELSKGLPGVVVEVDRPEEGPAVGKPLELEIAGDDFVTLGALAGRIRELIADIPGLVSLDDDFDLASPQVEIRIDRTEAARLGLTTAQIAGGVRTAINGNEASTWRKGEEDEAVDVVVRFQEAARQSLADLERVTLVSEDGAQVPLSSVARLERTKALTSINHKNQKRVVTVFGDVTSPQLAEPVRAEARRRIDATPGLIPAGVSLTFAGANQEEDEAKSFLSRAFLYALIIVLALIVGQFNSVVVPGIIMTSVLLSTVGVLLGLVITGLPFGIIMTGLGVISLAGIVVNNAIVLLDYGEQLRATGLPRRELVLTTGERRFRPVMLTAVTTILGLIPLTTGVEIDFRSLSLGTGGESSQWWKGMGVAVIFGLAFATFLTLVVVPVLYDLLLEARERWGAGRQSGGEGEAQGRPSAAFEEDEALGDDTDEVPVPLSAREAEPALSSR